MRILYFAQYFNLPHEPGGSRVYQFMRAWARSGHQVTLITGNVNYKSGTVDRKFRGRFISEETIDGVRVLRVWVYARTRGSYRRRYVNFLSYAFSAAIAGILRGGKADVVYATSTPLTAGIPGYLNAAFRKTPFVFEVRDLWPESAVVAGALSARSRLTRAADRLARFFYARAALVVAVTRGILEGLRRQGVPDAKLLLVPNGVDDWMVERPDPATSSRPALAAGDARRFEVVYCGAQGPWNGLGQILDAAALLRDRTEVEFAFIGDGEAREELAARAEREGLTRVRFEGTLPKQDAFERLCAADATIVVTWDHPFQRMVLANKIFDYMAAARPVVVAADGEMAELVREADAGLVVPPGRPELLATAIRELVGMPAAERDRLGRNARSYILRHYQRALLAERLLGRLEDVTGGGGRHATGQRVAASGAQDG